MLSWTGRVCKAFEDGKRQGAVEAFKECRALLCDFELNRIDKVVKVQDWLDNKVKELEGVVR